MVKTKKACKLILQAFFYKINSLAFTHPLPQMVLNLITNQKQSVVGLDYILHHSLKH